MNAIRIGTRASALARWQAEYVAGMLRPFAAPHSVELVTIQTEGDRARGESLSAIGGQGVFTKEIQRALLAGTVDIAVHSLKDLPTEPVQGLMLAAVPPRGPVADVLVSMRGRFDQLPPGARLATGSARRRALLLNRRADLTLVDIRGNVDTRLVKLATGDLDALVLAQAGLERLGRSEHITEVLPQQWMTPAVGQGALGIECRDDDDTVKSLLAPLDDWPSRAGVLAERAFLRALGGGCQTPIGAWTNINGNQLTLNGVVLAPDGSTRISGFLNSSTTDCELIGLRLATKLLAEGADRLLT